MKDNSFVSIIIANFNGEIYIKDCLDSVEHSNYRNFEIIIIDDGSSDRSIEIIKKYQKEQKKIIFLQNEKNIGAAASRNKACEIAKGDIIVFLDNDTQVQKNWLSELILVLTSSKDIAGCQALLLDYKKREFIQNAGGKLWAATGWLLPQLQWTKYKNQVLKNTEIIAISAALAMKKSAFQTIGGFDEEEGVVTEDLDLSWKIWLLGFRVMLAPKAHVYHWTKSLHMRQNMFHTQETIYFHLMKNSIISILKNYELGNAVYYYFYTLAISFCRGMVVLLRRGELSPLIGSLRGVIWANLNIATIIKKRNAIQRIRRSTDRELFKSIIIRDSPLKIYKKYFSQTNLL